MAETIIYPAGIDKSRTSYMTITSKTLEQKGEIEDAKNVTDTTADHIATSIFCQIMLPLPNTLQDSTSHNWEVAEGLTQEAGTVAGSILDKFTSSLGGAGGVASSGIVKLARKAGFNMDPKYWQMYNGTMPRTFSFDWTFVPESRIDATNMIRMIKLLKISAAPGAREGLTSLLLDSPNIFTLTFSNPILNDTVRLKEVVCTAINVDYMGQGYSDFYNNGYPKQVKLSMSFSERHTMYRQDYGEIVGGSMESSTSFYGQKGGIV